MEISVEVDSNIICLKLAGSLVASTLDAVKTQVQKLAEKKYVHIIFDMNRVDFVDSSGLGMCISTARELDAISGRLVCCGLKENVQKLFAMTRADQKITVMATRMNAFDHLFAKIQDAAKL
jgi:anti-sigma B factor antagonist